MKAEPSGPYCKLRMRGPWIIGEEEIGSVFADVARAAPFQAVEVNAVAVKIEHEDRSAVIRRPTVTEIDHAARVRVATAHREIGRVSFHLALRVSEAFPARV